MHLPPDRIVALLIDLIRLTQYSGNMPTTRLILLQYGASEKDLDEIVEALNCGPLKLTIQEPTAPKYAVRDPKPMRLTP